MRKLFFVLILGLVGGFFSLDQPVSAASTCSGTFSCTKYVGGDVVDDYLGQCNMVQTGSCTGSCPSGYVRDITGCQLSGGGGSTGGGECDNQGWTSATNWQCSGSCPGCASCKKGATSGSCKCAGGATCGGTTCTTSAPSAPSLTGPSDGVALSTNSTTLTWSGSSSFGTNCSGNNNQYLVYVGSSNPPSTLVATLASTVTSYNLSNLATTGATQYWRVAATNGGPTTSSSTRSFVLPGLITGTVYDDPGNTCSTATGANVGGGLSTALRGTAYTGSVASNGTYSIMAPAGSYSFLDLNGIGANTCSTACIQGCPSATSVSVPSVGNNFFLTAQKESWWL